MQPRPLNIRNQPMQYELHLKQETGEAVLNISGELDAGSAPAIEHALKDIIASGHCKITIDSAELTYISSAGIGAFISTIDQLRSAGGALSFTGLRPNVRRVFDLLGLDQVFTLPAEENG